MTLGVLKRLYKDFNDESALKMLYFSLTWSHFNYASLIWYTNNMSQNSLTTVQNVFLRYLIFIKISKDVS